MLVVIPLTPYFQINQLVDHRGESLNVVVDQLKDLHMNHRNLLVGGPTGNIGEVSIHLMRSLEEVGTIIGVFVEKIDEEDQPT